MGREEEGLGVLGAWQLPVLHRGWRVSHAAGVGPFHLQDSPHPGRVLTTVLLNVGHSDAAPLGQSPHYMPTAEISSPRPPLSSPQGPGKHGTTERARAQGAEDLPRDTAPSVWRPPALARLPSDMTFGH